MNEVLKLIGELGQNNAEVQQILQQLGLFSAVVTFVFAMLQCFFGYRFLKFWIQLIGFVTGFSLGVGFTTYYAGTLHLAMRLIIGTAAGIFLAYLAFKLYLLGVFLLGGFAAAAALGVFLFQNQALVLWQWIVLGIAFIAAGILAVKFQRAAIIIITAIGGAIHAVNAMRRFVPELSGNESYTLLAMAGLSVLGLIVQFMTTKEKKHHW